jgi:DNA-binding transcriptional MocR family regulator
MADSGNLLQPAAASLAESPIRAMAALAGQAGVISLAGGHPDPALLPLEWLTEMMRELAPRLRNANLQYGPTAGVPELKEAVCEFLRQGGIAADAAEVLVTTGSQQGLSLLSQALIAPGDRVAMAAFNYPASLQAFRFASAKICAVDDDFTVLGDLCSEAPVKALYVVPRFANPTGHCMSLEARLALLRTAAAHAVCVVEDDPYSQLWFDAPPPPSLYSLNQKHGIGAAVAHTTSFSKIIMPALRLGILLAPPAMRRAAVCIKQFNDMHSGLLEQYALAAILKSGRLLAHTAMLRARYAEKAAAMAEALAAAAAGIRFAATRGGMFTWAELSSGNASDIDWFDFGRKHRVLALPGRVFAVSNGTDSHLRLSFVNPSLDAVREGIKRLTAGLAASARVPVTA